MDFSPPSLEVRKVIRIGVSPRTARSSFKTSSTFSKSKTPSNQSTRHSTISTGIESNVLASSMISCLVTPTIGTMIFGVPEPISIFLTLIVFIIRESFHFINKYLFRSVNSSFDTYNILVIICLYLT